MNFGYSKTKKLRKNQNFKYFLHYNLLKKYGSFDKIPLEERTKADKMSGRSINHKVNAWIYARDRINKEEKDA